jgi:TPR repeat protein
MKCVLCAPFRWLCARITGWCKEFEELSRTERDAWCYGQANDGEIWNREAEPDLLTAAKALRQTDPAAAFRHFLEFAEQGSVWSMTEVANSYAWGSGVARDPEQEEAWARRASEGGSQRGMLHYISCLCGRKDYATAEAVVAAAAAGGWAPAQYWLAVFKTRRSTDRETLAEVRTLLERSAAQGCLAAEHRLAGLMMRGRYGLSEMPRGFRLGMAVADKMLAGQPPGAVAEPPREPAIASVRTPA